ncbi:MAG: MFS transporter [Candidatus Caccosoma sp.]|nr:MFS transporter [Candidatus Caccosoma sp.]
MKKTKKITISMIMFTLSLIYFTSYISRKSLGVLITELINATSLSKEQLSIPLTIIFITYGFVQMFAGIICDKFNTKYITISALLISGLTNIIISFCYDNIVLLSILWGINGIVQAFIWPALVKIMSTSLDDKHYDKAATLITIGGYSGQCFLYIIAYFIVKSIGFRHLFTFAFLLCFLTSLLNLFVIKNNKSNEITEEYISIEKSNTKQSSFLSFMFIIILIIIVFAGAYRGSIESWTPTFIYEVFNISSDKAIIVSLALPLLSIVFVEISLIAYKKLVKNPIYLAAILMGLGALSSILLIIFNNKSEYVSLILMAMGFGFSSAALHTITSYIPLFYKNTGKISMIASLLNAFTYVGSAIATYFIGYICSNDVYGWNGAIICWIILGMASTILLISIFKPWNKKQLNH